IGVLNTAKKELIELEREKKELEVATIDLEKAKHKLEEETKQLERDKQERDEKIGAMSEEQMKLLEEYEKVKIELSKFAKMAEEAESQELNFDRIQALLSIFRVLVEKIWQGQPHYKILMTLHGDKESMTREELKNTTGIGGAYILRAVQELANVDLVEHDIDTATVTLKQRLYSKTALDKK
ncbi:MAG: hypothetical protein ACFFCM_21995, partial [Promethearchaeota archaeon]